jgi:two-component system cell cycle response regulator
MPYFLRCNLLDRSGDAPGVRLVKAASHQTNLPQKMNAETTPHCVALKFNDKRIQEVLSILGLSMEHQVLAERIRTEVIAGRADEFADLCFATAGRSQSFVLIEKHIGAEPFKQALVSRLRSFGRNFDTAGYFEERLAMAAAFARAKIPLGALQLPYLITQQVLINSLQDRLGSDSLNTQPLLDAVLKFISLDLYLRAEGYYLPELDELEEDLDKLREEASRLQQKTWTDELTGVMSYAKLMDSLEHQIERSRRRGHERNPLCLIMSDLDFFKKINDNYGHVVGDHVLRHVAGRIQAATRDFDIVGRFGGEEFVIIMANTDLELAKIIAERIRVGIMSTPIHVKQFNIAVTISLGVAMLRPDDRKESLLERADAAMYEAKRRGRNCVVCVDDSARSQ